ncbi:sensor histidine kinase [Wenxinia saemankumensis]|uniref:histidine kinase n=1 Tax=Wenxinia saemankumensis TaxID=1447782 RepID=A0A1M6AA12_9RHOB|nr:HAMP domain-containing sensor histidine kinase [Wenxinia saemankumensis]SHI33301.1 Histidine kinase-, DNA gyrase B-, and HSP90-like ATPase [Wenxinia saemankumensis]
MVPENVPLRDPPPQAPPIGALAGAGPPVAPEDEVDELVYRISHDLRASIRALQELPSWIIEDLGDSGTASPRSHLSHIASHARRLDQMLNGLLEYARVGRLQTVARLSPGDVLDDVIDDLGPPGGVTIENGLPAGVLCFGATDLRRVFMILLTNAIRHNPARPARIAVTGGVVDGAWEITVTDDGPGIPAEARAAVIRPLVKLSSRDVDEGPGMGLAILHKIADRAGGDLRIDDGPGGGTAVTIRLGR